MENENTLQQQIHQQHVPNSSTPPSSSNDTITPDYLTVNAEDWENNVVWDETVASALEEEYMERGKPPKFNYIVRNEHLESGEWLDAIVWDDGQARKVNVESVDAIMEDIFDPTVATFTPASASSSSTLTTTTITTTTTKGPTTRTITLDKFNISNDKYYENHKLRTGRARHTFGPLVLQHSLPAVKLFRQYFKTGFTLKDMRAWHRPPISFPINMDIKLSKVKNKKKLQKKLLKSGGSSGDLVKKSKDLTLKDNSKYVLFEYSEEYPPFMQNVGMASIIYNYYRKKDEKDAFVPNMDYGAPMVLELTDASPFFDMGDVIRGQILPTLWNNLVRAPMFRQKVKDTDFLLIKHTHHGETKYFLREIPAIYVVGQTFPVMEAPPPASRKYSNIAKSRLAAVTFRYIRKDQMKRIKFEYLSKAFPNVQIFTLRQKLKEIAISTRNATGGVTGLWKLRAPPPPESEIQKLVSPEAACIYEAVLVGHQRLKDVGYGDDNEERVEENGDEENALHVEEQLAPWNVSQNFLQATQGKALLKLYGAGDPTSRGEGFSFIRASTKEMFHRAGAAADERMKSSKMTALEQQKAYREEIARIWNAQLRSLGNTEELVLTDEEDETERASVVGDLFEKKDMQGEEEFDRPDDQSSHPGSPAYSATGAMSPPAMGAGPMSPASRPMSPPAMSTTGGVYSEGEEDNISVTGSLRSGTSLNVTRNKALVIKRLVKLHDGSTTWKSDVIKDQKVINAYIRQRRMIEQSVIGRGLPISEEEVKKRRRKKTEDAISKLKSKKEAKKRGPRRKRPLPEMVDEMGGPGANDLGASMNSSYGMSSSTASLKKSRKDSFVMDDGMIPYRTSTGRGRRVPEVELANIFDRILTTLITIPDYHWFAAPVSTKVAPDYYKVITKPMYLDKIREATRLFQCLKYDEVVRDLYQISENSKIYNGEQSPITAIARQMVTKALEMLEEVKEEIVALEKEIHGA